MIFFYLKMFQTFMLMYSQMALWSKQVYYNKVRDHGLLDYLAFSISLNINLYIKCWDITEMGSLAFQGDWDIREKKHVIQPQGGSNESVKEANDGCGRFPHSHYWMYKRLKYVHWTFKKVPPFYESYFYVRIS